MTHVRMTYDEMRAGALCRGPRCGLPLRDDVPRPWHDKGTMYFTPEESAANEREWADLQVRHKECRGGWWSMEGQNPMHCAECCPPAPLSPEQIALSVSMLRIGKQRYEEAQRVSRRGGSLGPA